ATITAPTSRTDETTPVTLSSMMTDGMDDDAPITYAWSVTSSNGQTASGSSSSLTFTPTDDGTYTVSLTGTDKDGLQGTDSVTITVTTKAPTATITGSPGSVQEGTAVTLGSTVTDGVDNDGPITYAWSVTS